MNALVPHNNAEAFRASTDAASMCRGIVVETAMQIQGRKYVKVEGWQAIAIAHGCTGSARDVEKVEGGVRAIGEVRRMSDGQVIAEAEGFVGEDEPTWYGGEVVSKWGKKTLPRRPDYAIRAMAQTRAISRACRSAFAHVVVMMNAGLSTTPAEEVPLGGFDDMRDVTPHADEAPVSARLNASQAKKAGKGAIAATLSNEIVELQSVTECLAWKREHEAETSTWPQSWETELHERLEIHMDELRALVEADFRGEGEGDLADGVSEMADAA